MLECVPKQDGPRASGRLGGRHLRQTVGVLLLLLLLLPENMITNTQWWMVDGGEVTAEAFLQLHRCTVEINGA